MSRILRKVSDIRKPVREEEETQSLETPIDTDQAAKLFTNEEISAPIGEPPLRYELARHTRSLVIGTFLALAGMVLIGGFLFRDAYERQDVLLSSAAENFDTYQSALGDLNFLGMDSSEEKFKTAENEFGVLIKDEAGVSSLMNFWPFLKDSGRTLKNLKDVAGATVQLVGEIRVFKKDLPRLIFAQQGAELVGRLEAIGKKIETINMQNEALSSTFFKLRSIIPYDFSAYLPLQLDMKRLEGFLEAFVAWLKTPSERHVLVLFENSSELRATGGFLGSYADITLGGGTFKNIEVHDINDADRGFTDNIVPPAPLQAMRTRFRIADANWFFDFPQSARKVLEFIESSSIYKERGVTFDGVIAITPRVINDLLALTGPLELSDYKFTAEKDTFLIELQKRIEASRVRKDEEPKKILSAMTALLLEKLTDLGSADAGGDLSIIEEWLVEKDAMLYFKDPDMQRFFEHYEWAGGVAALPPGWNGDYLAVVNTNIDGAKTDLFTSEKVALQSQLDVDGTVSNHLAIERMHQGEKSTYAWYRAPNQDYLRIFTPLGAKIMHITGGTAKKIIPPANYERLGYRVDPQVASIESTLTDYLSYPEIQSFEESSRNVFATWLVTKRGETSTTILNYDRKLPLPPKHGQTYQFIFEKQAGSRGSYSFQINAPIGFRWQENQLPIFEYATDDPPGRLSIFLTLEKI